MTERNPFRGRSLNPRPDPNYNLPDLSMSRPSKSTHREKVTVIPQKVVPDLPGLDDLKVSPFPIHLIVTGTNSGDYIDLVTEEVSSVKSSNSINYRQYILQKIRPRGGDIVKLVPEPDNSFDSNAIKVCVEWDGNWVAVGYIPAKPKESPGVSFMCNTDILTFMAEKQLYTTGWVTYKDGSDILGYRITIKDHII